MKLPGAGRPHLTYCTNIHPGEGALDVQRHVARHVVDVKRHVCPDAAFGVGLRISAQAAREFQDESASANLAELLASNHLYAFTFNGFPYGAFHGERVKERVYAPDWTTEQRLNYTDDLARLLARLLPPDVDGSISTVPGGFRRDLHGDAEPRVARQLARHVVTLFRLFQDTGRRIELGLEPEPCCYLETTDEAIRFFEQWVFAPETIRYVADATNQGRGDAEATLRRHLGVCFDTCHAAVEFERPEVALMRLERAAIRISKVQLSAGLEVPAESDASAERRLRAALEAFADEIYLHQVVEDRGGSLIRYLDLPNALAAAGSGKRATWRIHFHVPIFLAALDPFTSTQPFLQDTIRQLCNRPLAGHWEVETYTWDVLPAAYRTDTVEAAIARELSWVLAQADPTRVS